MSGLTGIAGFAAGKTLANLPTLDPEKEGWEQRREVVTTCVIEAEGEPVEFIELDADYALLAARGRVYLLRVHRLDGAEEKEIENQRKDACTRGDGVIESYLGTSWSIKAAYGEVQGRPSTIRVTGVDPRIRGGGIRSALSSELLRTDTSKYFDLRAVANNDGRYLYAFWADGRWHCWIGRELEQAEIDRIEAR